MKPDEFTAMMRLLGPEVLAAEKLLRHEVLAAAKFESSLRGIARLESGLSRLIVSRHQTRAPMPSCGSLCRPPVEGRWRAPTQAISNEGSQPTRRPIGFRPWPE